MSWTTYRALCDAAAIGLVAAFIGGVVWIERKYTRGWLTIGAGVCLFAYAWAVRFGGFGG